MTSSLAIAILTEATCGEACWCAREDVCRCSCGGKNHGCLRTSEGIRPNRTAKIDGFRYELKAFGKYGEMHSEARFVNHAAPKRKMNFGNYEYYWDASEPGAPARVKSATHAQFESWPELASAREANIRPYLLWVRVSEVPNE